MLILFSFFIIFNVEKFLCDWMGMRIRPGQKTILRRCFFRDIPNSVTVRRIRCLLAWNCIRMYSDMNQSSVQQNINNVKNHPHLLLKNYPFFILWILFRAQNKEKKLWDRGDGERSLIRIKFSLNKATATLQFILQLAVGIEVVHQKEFIKGQN